MVSLSTKGLLAIAALANCILALPASTSAAVPTTDASIPASTSIPVKRGVPTTTIAAVPVSTSLAKRDITGAPTQLMECPDVDDDEEWQTKKISFNDWTIEDAITDGLKHPPPTAGNSYSKRYYNYSNLAMSCGACDSGDNVCYEYPLMKSGKTYGGSGEPLGFRVIFKTSDFASGNAQYCATLYHPRNSDGSLGTGFASCSAV